MPVSVEEHTSTIPVVLLGSTGSIGTQAREVIEANRGRFDVLGLSAGGASITGSSGAMRGAARKIASL